MVVELNLVRKQVRLLLKEEFGISENEDVLKAVQVLGNCKMHKTDQTWIDALDFIAKHPIWAKNKLLFLTNPD